MKTCLVTGLMALAFARYMSPSAFENGHAMPATPQPAYAPHNDLGVGGTSLGSTVARSADHGSGSGGFDNNTLGANTGNLIEHVDTAGGFANDSSSLPSAVAVGANPQVAGALPAEIDII